jgi:CheY-like chemotaxis protein
MSDMSVFRVLQIEDNEGDVLALRRSLKRAGADAEVMAVAHAEQALEILAEAPPSHFGLILVDINLPGMSGLDLLKALKTESYLAEVPLFVLSSSLRDGDVELAYAQGADGFLAKPGDADGYAGLACFLVDIWNGSGAATYDGLRVPGQHTL